MRKFDWAEISEYTVMEIGRFAILWNRFEAYYFDKSYSRSRLDATLPTLLGEYDEQSTIEVSLAMNKRIQELDLHGLGNDCTDYYIRTKLGVTDRGNDIIDVKNFIDNYFEQGQSDRMRAAIISIHRIRCNMFHGEKDADATDIRGLSAQIPLFESINKFLFQMVRA